MLIDAPQFHEIAGDILERFEGRYFIGHNIQFDAAMLQGEFNRMGLTVPAPHRLCTLRMAYKLGPQKRKLIDCCNHFGIKHHGQHQALDDARVTLQLWRAYKELVEKEGKCVFNDFNAYAEGDEGSFPKLKKSGRVYKREHHAAKPRQTYLRSIIDKTPEAGTFEIAAYYSALDRVLEDRKVTDDEMHQLETLAIEASLSKEAVLQAHRDYLRSLVRIALADGKLTSSEKLDLEKVNQLLGFERTHLYEVIDAVRKPLIPETKIDSVLISNEEFVGKKVCFTGTLKSTLNGVPIAREQALQLVAERGMIATNSLTKAVDILVVADPDTMSGKAKTARKYGTRIMADRAFWMQLGVKVD
jgi:DNA polymerase-3 subunit epsilon